MDRRLPDLLHVLRALPEGAAVLDYGCLGWPVHAAARALGRTDLKHAGCDIAPPRDTPEGAAFFLTDAKTGKTACADDGFDLVVVTHVLEHVPDPVGCFCEIARMCRPGGVIYVETPSDRAALVPGDPDVEGHGFLSFWDDPTHVRPFSPGALYRLGISFGIRPRACGYVTSFRDRLLLPFRALHARLLCDGAALTRAVWAAKGWCSRAVFVKPADLRGAPAYRFISLEHAPRGVENALAVHAARAPGEVS